MTGPCSDLYTHAETHRDEPRRAQMPSVRELKQELDEESSRCLLLSRQSLFNQRCCIRCCAPFTFLLKPRRRCRDCRYFVCKACCLYNKRDKASLCSTCQKSRLLKTRSLEWFYANVKSRFKRFGSAKVLKTLYKKHLEERGALSDHTEGSTYEESICNEGSVCGSDSAFYRQSEEHSMAESLTVALRVAGEAIDEAISKAEVLTDNQHKQNEAQYLREHRQELIEELAKTIMQKIISRRKTLAEIKPEHDQDCPPDHGVDEQHRHYQQPACGRAPGSPNYQPSLRRSRSAFSLLDSNASEVNSGVYHNQDLPQGFKKDVFESAMSIWKSADRLDNSMLKSPDGNWIALQSAQWSRSGLLTKRKGPVYRALERESGVVSAYEGLSSESEEKPEPNSSWHAALREAHRKSIDCNFKLQDTHRDRSRFPSPPMGSRGSGEDLTPDSEGTLKSHKPLPAHYKRKVPQEMRRLSSSHRTSIINMNFNPEGFREESSGADELEVGQVRRSRKKRRCRKEQLPISSSVPDYDHRFLDTLGDNQSQHAADAVTPDTLTSETVTPEPFDLRDDITEGGVKQADPELTFKLKEIAGMAVSISQPYELDRRGDSDGPTEKRRTGATEKDKALENMGIDVDGGRVEDGRENMGDEEETRYKLGMQVEYFLSTDDEQEGVDQSERDLQEEDMTADGQEWREGDMEELAFKLQRLERAVQASQFSSTEDELDRVGLSDGHRGRGAAEDVKKEELALKVCRLASQVNAAQFSSTEDELDRAGQVEGSGGGEEEDRAEEQEEVIDEETLWKMEAEKMVQGAQVRDLASLVSASQFSSTEDELDRAGESMGAVHDGEIATEDAAERTELWYMKMERDDGEESQEERWESIDDVDMRMFDFEDELESDGERATDSKEALDGGEVSHTETVMQDERRVDGVNQDEMGEEESEKTCEEERVTAVTNKDGRRAEEHNDMTANTLGEEERETEDKGKTGRRRTSSVTLEKGVHEEFNILQHKPGVEMVDGSEGQLEEITDKNRKGGKAGRDEESVKTDRMISSSMYSWPLEEMQTDTLADKVKDRCWEPEESSEKLEVGERNEDDETVGTGGTEGGVVEENEGNVGGNLRKNRQQKTKPDPENRNAQPDLEMVHSVVIASNEIAEQTHGASVEYKRTKEEDEQDRKATQEEMLVEEQTMERQGNRVGGTEENESEERESDEPPKGTKEEEEGALSDQEGILSPEEIQKRYSAVSLCSITTEMLKVLNATEELLQGVEGGDRCSPQPKPSLPPNTDPKKLDQQFSRLEEKVYVAAGTVYGLETELGDLEECARSISSATSDKELSFLEEQVASAAAKVHQSELQISNISARIAALKTAGLNVDPHSRFTKARTIPIMPITLDSSRQLRRRLPAPPITGSIVARVLRRIPFEASPQCSQQAEELQELCTSIIFL
ncbi:uncharacterized protein myripa [Lampris incognitus]|uniref:uncharacterized protein myripa n=1 Tax=Lampris incognitus TaxID=2546036 RepID=UPI0024B554DE|nr:uncharacterized protein myripa [Lampris incognitus]